MGCTHSKATLVADPTHDSAFDNDTTNDEDSWQVPPSMNPQLKHSGSSRLRLEEMKSECDELQVQVVHIETQAPIEQVYDGVHDGTVLGEGVLGKVRLITHKSTGVQYAVKCLDLRQIETEDKIQQLREEIYILCQLDHPNVVRLEEVYETETEIFLVQELCLGGDLFDRLEKQPNGRYTEEQCAGLVLQMLAALRYIHAKGIVHRDLKLENFLFSCTAPDSDLKMIDFGLAKHFNPSEVHHEVVGTPYTVAPEVIQGSYDEKCDLWGVGVLTFLLLSGEAPFGGCYEEDNPVEVRKAILDGIFAFEPPEIWSDISPEAMAFINRLLVTDPTCRPTAREAQESKWLQECAQCKDDTRRDVLSPDIVKALICFKEYSEIQKLLREVLSFTLLPEQIVGLRREFQKLDTDGSGEISLSGLKHVLMQNQDTGLTEKEVEEIFNALRVRKTESRIHWHEFIAAGLSSCAVDERNLKLAFDRLDSDRKGYIAFQDVMHLVGNGASENDIRQMWVDAMRTCKCGQKACLTYAEFLYIL